MSGLDLVQDAELVLGLEVVADMKCVAIIVVAGSHWSITECLYSVSLLPQSVSELSELRLTFRWPRLGAFIWTLVSEFRRPTPIVRRDEGHVRGLEKHESPTPVNRRPGFVNCGLGQADISVLSLSPPISGKICEPGWAGLILPG